jgi:hypothetical protein
MQTPKPARRSHRRAVIRITARGYILLTKYELQGIATSLAALRTAIVAHDAAGGAALPSDGPGLLATAADMESRS